MIRNVHLLNIGLLSIALSTSHAGVYVGAGLGPDTVDFKQKGYVYQPGSFDVVDQTHLSGRGIFGTIFLGYSYLFGEHFNLASEVNANISSLAFHSSNSEFVHNNVSGTFFKMNNSFGVSLLPGFQFNPNTLFYGRVGYTNAELKVSTTDTSLANINDRLNGFRYGLGIKQAITQKIAVRMDYSRVDYNDTYLNSFDAGSTTTKNTKISTNQQLVEFAVIYNFDRPAPANYK